MPVWSADGRRLFFFNGPKLLERDHSIHADVCCHSPRHSCSTEASTAAPIIGAMYDAAPDADLFRIAHAS
jgi:hypothetical protein